MRPFLRISMASAALALAGLGNAPALAADWYFYVQNNSSSAITKLEVRERSGSWGFFQLGGASAPGRNVRLDWDASTNNEDCLQYIRATFADGATSEPAAFNFCEDLDTPIVFED